MQFDIDFVTAAQCCCSVASYCKTANKDEPRPDFLLGNLPQDVHCADYKRGDTIIIMIIIMMTIIIMMMTIIIIMMSDYHASFSAFESLCI